MDEIEQKDGDLTNVEETDEVVEEADDESSDAHPEPKKEVKQLTDAEKYAKFTRLSVRYGKKLGITPESTPEPVTTKSNPSELDDTQLDYLDLKGISEQEDLDVITSVMQKTGKTLRDTLKDSYVVSALESNKKARDVKNATPSSNNRSGNQSADVGALVDRYEQTGKLPEDFELRSKVVEALASKNSPHRPSWRR